MAKADAQQASFLQRLTSYPLVKYTCDTTLRCYTEAKERNTLLKKGLDLAETYAGTVAASSFVLNVSKSCEPLLTKADQFGCSQLDKAEVKLFKPAAQLYSTANATFVSTTNLVEEKVSNSKKLVEERVVQPISSTYLQLVSLPSTLTNKVFDFAEDSIEYYLPYEESDGEKEAFTQVEEGPAQSNEAAQSQSVWARGTTLSRSAYRRAARRAARRARLAKLYGKTVLTKYPLATTAANYIRTRDPEIRDNLVQQVKTTAAYYTDATKGFLAGRPFVSKAVSFVQPYLNFAYQTVYPTLLALIALVSSKARSDVSVVHPSSSSSATPSSDDEYDEPEVSDDNATSDDEHANSSGPAEPTVSSDDVPEKRGETPYGEVLPFESH